MVATESLLLRTTLPLCHPGAQPANQPEGKAATSSQTAASLGKPARQAAKQPSSQPALGLLQPAAASKPPKQPAASQKQQAISKKAKQGRGKHAEQVNHALQKDAKLDDKLQPLPLLPT